MRVEIEDIVADRGLKALARGDGDDTGSRGEQLREEDREGSDGHGVVDLFSILVKDLQQKSVEASVLPGSPERLENSASWRDSAGYYQFPCAVGEKRWMEVMVTPLFRQDA